MENSKKAIKPTPVMDIQKVVYGSGRVVYLKRVEGKGCNSCYYRNRAQGCSLTNCTGDNYYQVTENVRQCPKCQVEQYVDISELVETETGNGFFCKNCQALIDY